MDNTENIATLAGGCFWCLEAVYDELKGVLSVESGYSGGHVLNPTYNQISQGNTGHAEVVRIAFDPNVITYRDLLNIFFTIHDPTTLNRQGPDFGSQYRSAVFYHSPGQQAAAVVSKEKLEKARRFPRPIVTQIVPAATFWPAEEYHQKYFQKHGGGSCHVR